MCYVIWSSQPHCLSNSILTDDGIELQRMLMTSPESNSWTGPWIWICGALESVLDCSLSCILSTQFISQRCQLYFQKYIRTLHTITHLHTTGPGRPHSFSWQMLWAPFSPTVHWDLHGSESPAEWGLGFLCTPRSVAPRGMQRHARKAAGRPGVNWLGLSHLHHRPFCWGL